MKYACYTVVIFFVFSRKSWLNGADSQRGFTVSIVIVYCKLITEVKLQIYCTYKLLMVLTTN